MTYHYHGIDAEESILTKSLPNLGTWALPNLFYIPGSNILTSLKDPDVSTSVKNVCI